MTPTPETPTVVTAPVSLEFAVVAEPGSPVTYVRMSVTHGAAAFSVLLDVDQAEQLGEQLPAVIAGAVAAARRNMSGLVLPPEPPSGLLRG